MKTKRQFGSHGVAGAMSLAVMLVVLGFAGMAGAAGSGADTVKQKLFATPEDAAKALAAAAKSGDRTTLAAIFGPDYDKLLSGDEVQDKEELTHFAANVDKSVKIEKAADDRVTLAIGDEAWPFPIPIVKEQDQWHFDTKTGEEEILNRRIGENELSAIATCRAYVLAQWEYFTGEHDEEGLATYAQHLYSNPGRHDGLYWETAEGDKPSPLGEFVASARAEGYEHLGVKTPAGQPHQRHAYHGYYFKILKVQGTHAPGGKFSYIINGNMIAGYALIAYPDKWGSSGVMTFIVNNQGRVYQKNLGPDTEKLAREITEFDPDASWKRVKD